MTMLVQFCNILLYERDIQVTEGDWQHLEANTCSSAGPSAIMLHLYLTIEAVAEHNVTKLCE